jgi:hypothetical protein
MSGSPFSTRMPRASLVRVRDAAGSTVSAEAGTVWITEEGSARLAIVEAWSDAAVTFEMEAP